MSESQDSQNDLFSQLRVVSAQQKNQQRHVRSPENQRVARLLYLRHWGYTTLLMRKPAAVAARTSTNCSTTDPLTLRCSADQNASTFMRFWYQ